MEKRSKKGGEFLCKLRKSHRTHGNVHPKGSGAKKGMGKEAKKLPQQRNDSWQIGPRRDGKENEKGWESRKKNNREKRASPSGCKYGVRPNPNKEWKHGEQKSYRRKKSGNVW